MKKLAIVGASGHGKVVAEIAELNGWAVCFFDDAFPSLTQLEHWPVVGNTQTLIESMEEFSAAFIAIGNNVIRQAKQYSLQEFGLEFPVLIHPSAQISRYATIESGTVVMAGAVINPFAKIGGGCIVNTSATIDHDCEINDGVHISPGAHLAGGVKVGSLSWVGIGACVRQYLTIGEAAMIGAGAVVVSDVVDKTMVKGVPARVK